MAGNLGIAILTGILATLSDTSSAVSTQNPSFPITTKFIACVRSTKSSKRIEETVAPYSNYPVKILRGQNPEAVRDADIVILGCKPWMLKDVLGEPGIIEALSGKLLISILAGVPVEQIHEALYVRQPTIGQEARIVRVLPNTAAIIRESMTVIATPNPPLPEALDRLMTWMFSSIGKVIQLPATSMDASTALAGSAPAFMALVLEGIADGAVAMGIPRAEAQLMAAQVMKGAAGLVQSGEHPSVLKEKVSTPGGCTIGGLLVLEEAAVRGSLARAIREATVVASQLGMGVRNVNGTRH
jgi:pyrroline-5-carboxylate reductase